MNEPKAQGQEPTMEEILASIRRIISENDDPGAAAASGKANQPSAPRPAAPNDGVLELTDMVGADGKVVSLAAAKPAIPVQMPEPPAKQESPPMVEPIPESPAVSQSAPQSAEMAADDVELSPAELSPAAPASRPADDMGDALVGATTAATSTAAFAALAKQLRRDGPAAPSSIPIGSGRTLEDLVQEMIRPMLREWLDANLPGMVERMIKREIERIVRQAES